GARAFHADRPRPGGGFHHRDGTRRTGPGREDARPDGGTAQPPGRGDRPLADLLGDPLLQTLRAFGIHDAARDIVGESGAGKGRKVPVPAAVPRRDAAIGAETAAARETGGGGEFPADLSVGGAES